MNKIEPDLSGFMWMRLQNIGKRQGGLKWYCDCVEFLHLALIEAKSLNKEEIEGKLKEYREFRNVAYKNYLSKKEKLNKVEALAFGKYIVANAKEARTMFKKEKAFSCYLYDCREALLTRLYDVDSKCPQVNKVLEHYRKFDLMASKRLEEKVKAIKIG